MIRQLLVLVLAAQTAAPQIAAIAHRGEHQKHVENTMAAYQSAIDLGADFIEVDVRTTSDGRMVVMHDGNADRTTDGHGPIAAMTFADVQRLRTKAGDRVPEFEEVLALARGRISVYVDVKQVAPEPLLAALEKHGAAERAVVYCGFDYARQLLDRQPSIRVMPEASSLERVRRIVAELRPKVIAFDARDFKDDIIAIARDAGAGVFVDRLGQADNPAAWEDAVQRGATGIQTDHPAELLEFLRSRKLHK
jgi:glycerophosphoryl diester phosphodiesterase